MASDTGLTAESILAPHQFNWPFLVELLVCGFLALFFLFYFNRVFAKIISIAVRLYLRWTGDPHYIDIQSLQISPLGGRIFFGKVIYHGTNESIAVVSGHITWRYWLRRVRDVALTHEEGASLGGNGKRKDYLPCRIAIELKGLEWFVYNRSPAYDNIAEQMAKQAEGYGGDRKNTPASHATEELREDVGNDGKQASRAETMVSRGSHSTRAMRIPEESLEDMIAGSPYLQMLPIGLEVSKGAVVMGNNNAPSILVAKFDRASGVVDAAKTRSSCDKYKQQFNISFEKPVVQFRTNFDFKESLYARGVRIQRRSSNASAAYDPHRVSNTLRTTRQKLRDLLPLFSASTESITPSEETPPPEPPVRQQNGTAQWTGLQRYQGEEEPDEDWKFEPAEYARVTNVLDCNALNMSFYWDVPGVVPEYEDFDLDKDDGSINGPHQQSPEWGIDLSVFGGMVHYGPWADRQRIHLQNMFAPKLYKSANPAERIQPGQDRVYTEFKVFIELSDATTLRVPLREASKDWKYRRRLDEGENRPYGWLEFKVAGESTINYNMGMIARQTGWNSGLDLELRSPEVRTSVNHGLLWQAEKQTLQCDLSGPLEWNADTTWIISNVSRGMKLFLLREHVTLMTDLVADWTDGPGAEYWTFIPMVYKINLRLENFEFFFNVNDQNIVNNPSDFDDNTFIFFRNLQKDKGWLSASVSMDFREYRPPSSIVDFAFEMDGEVPGTGTLEIGATMPVWNTYNTFLKEKGALGHVKNIKVAGSYEVFAGTSPGVVDTLNLHIEGNGLLLELYGFLIRYFLIVKENYFGDNVHFKTLEEWQNRGVEPTPGKLTSKSNDLDVLVSCHATDLCVLLPRQIYDSKQHLRLELPTLGVDMRFTNYYMDLQIDLGPMSGSLGSEVSTIPQVFVGGLSIFGHRLFGLPPTEPTYVCNWDIELGTISGECATEFLQTTMFSLKAFAFGFKDVENALPVPGVPVIYDVTFLRLKVAAVKLWLRMDGSQAFRLTADGISLVLNDLADEQHSDRIVIKIPGLAMTCMDVDKRHAFGTKGYLATEAKITVFGKKKDATRLRRLQREHVRESDFRTGRSRFLLKMGDTDSHASSIYNDIADTDPPSMCLPGLPSPLYDLTTPRFSPFEESTTNFDTSSRTTVSSGRKSSARSFLIRTHSSSSKSLHTLKRTASSNFAPSFVSALESLSDQPIQTPTGTVNPPYPLSPSSSSRLHTPRPTTPASRSPRRRAMSTRSHRPSFAAGARSMNVVLQSAFAKPVFPLDHVEPDLTNVPELSAEHVRDIPGRRDTSGAYEMFSDEETKRDSIVVEFNTGVRGYCTPEALVEVAHLLEKIQLKNPEDILDSIQNSVIAKLEAVVKKIVANSEVLEACVRIPHLHVSFVNPVSPDLSQEKDYFDDGSSDKYDVQLQNLLITARSKKIVVSPDDTPDQTSSTPVPTKEIHSLHLLLDSFKFGLSKYRPSFMPTRLPSSPAFGILIEDILLWASTADRSTASLQIKRFITSVESKQALFLYDAVQRAASMGKELAEEFSTVLIAEKKRVEQLVFMLISQGEELRITNDPASLTRPSYVLRSAADHVRLNDSWKIQSRLRHVWQSLTPTAQLEWARTTIENRGVLPQDARNRVIEVLDRWRGWEMTNIEESIIVNDIYGSSTKFLDAGSKDGAVNTALNIESIKLLIDPGPTQEELGIDGLSTSVVLRAPQAPVANATRAVTAPGIASGAVVQIHSKNIFLGIRWELLEAIETVVAVLASQEKSPISAKPSVDSISTVTKSGRLSPKPGFGGIHVVLVADTGTLSIDTVNLKLLSTTKNVKASVVISGSHVLLKEGNMGSVASGMLQADMSTTEITYGNKVLSKAVIRQPSLYAYSDQHWVAATKFNIWKITSSCEDFSFEIREQIMGLMEIVDFVVNDEVSHIKKILDKMKKSSPHSAVTRSTPKPPVSVTRNVHMFYLSVSADQFSLGATLLPSLAYLVRGGGARLWARPNSKDSKEMLVDFDILHHEHEVLTGSNPLQTRSISILELPAINGSVNFRDGEEEKLLEMNVSVEEIQLDASAIQSLINALNKPEVNKVIETAQAEWSGTQGRLNEIFGFDDVAPHSPSPPASGPGATFVYRAHGGVVGVKIQTSAPSANLEVNLGAIQVHASNKPTPESPLLSLPEIQIEFRKITVELTRDDVEKLRCGYVELHASLLMSSESNAKGVTVRSFGVKSRSLRIDLFAETASTVVDVAGHLQDKLRDLDLSREVKYLRKLRNSKSVTRKKPHSPNMQPANGPELLDSILSMELLAIQISWIVGGSSVPLPKGSPGQDLVLSFKRIAFATVTKKDHEAQLIIEEFLLQIIDHSLASLGGRSENSALLPEVIFKVAHRANDTERRLAFQAKGTSLDLRVTPFCVVGGNAIETSIATATQKFRTAAATWKSTPTESGAERKKLFGAKRLASVLVDADFAGAVVHLSEERSTKSPGNKGLYRQFLNGEASGSTELRSPGLAFKVEYVDPKNSDPSLSAEVKISASSNTLYPSVVPLVLEISNHIKEIVRQPSGTQVAKKVPEKSSEKQAKETEDTPAHNAAAILGRCRLNIGVRVCRQDFTLSCQPIARVAASAKYEEIYLTISTCDEKSHGRFYAVSLAISGIQTSLQHVYSRESTGNLEVESVVLSLMNSKHIMGAEGLSCIMKMSPIKAQINIKQFQDFLLFREIWYPQELRSSPAPEVPVVQSDDPSNMLVQRYHKVAATKAFPLNMTMIVSAIDLQFDLGQSLGKTALLISNLWVTSRKTSDWEQIMCLGFDQIRISSVGRLSGFIELSDMKVRTSINWRSAVETEVESFKAPLIEASIGLKKLQIKTSFDYQAFLIADITSFEFLMYNVQSPSGDRLVGNLDGEKVQIFCTTLSAAQGLALYQAFQRLLQEKMDAFSISLREVERFMNRRSSVQPLSTVSGPTPAETLSEAKPKSTSPPGAASLLSLHTNVVVTLKEVNVGAFPTSFHDTQVLNLEVLNATARFAAEADKGRIHSMLQMTLGQLRVALSSVKRLDVTPAGAGSDVGVEEVIHTSVNARGGTILKVPRVTAFMHTWHKPGSMKVDYIFKSAFEGQVDVGWNFSRVSFIKGMYQSHVKAFTLRQGKAPPRSGISVYTDAASAPGSDAGGSDASAEAASKADSEKSKASKKSKTEDKERKITAVVDVPQSKYEYTPLEPPVIETPQLRDMGEATPPLEWIGLHRERLPNLTHQIVIVSLLEVAKEVEDAYTKILGNS